MLRLTELSNLYKKRTLRVQYGNTQAYPYAATLSTNFDRVAGGQIAVTNSKAAINPGSVAVKLAGEVVTLANSTEGSAPSAGAPGATAARGFGLFANFVGGQLDELGTRSEVGVWRGPGSVYEILAPAFDSVGVAIPANSTEVGTRATEVYMNAATDGRLVVDAAATGTTAPLVSGELAVVRLISSLSANAIIVECLV